MTLIANIVYPDGRYPFEATADQSPGDVIVRPSGTLAVFDGFEDCKVGKLISPGPITPVPCAEFTALSTDTWAAGQVLHWDATNKRLTTTTSGNIRAGVSTVAKTSGQTSCLVECTPA